MGNRKKLKKAVYNAAQWTWGFPQTILGAGLFLQHRNSKHFEYKGAKVTAWKRNDGVSLGKFVFVPENKNGEIDDFILTHEYGHTLQSLILGPAYLLLVGIPSVTWNRLPYFANLRRKKGKSYYSAVFESTANKLGSRVVKRKG